MKKNGWAGALVLAMWTGTACAQMYQGNVEHQEIAGSWSSFAVQHGEDIRFRAYSANNTIGIVFDVLPMACASALSFTVPYAKPSEQDSGSSQLGGAVRIDDGPIHSVTFTVGASAMGDLTYSIMLNVTPEYGQIIKEMDVGQNVRVRFDLPSPSTSIVQAFALNGFSVASNRAFVWCKATVNAFQKNRKQKPPKASSPSVL
ncbi:hypothetical protein WM29_26370 [Burkholderia ubonensis]|uniref:hypothetical protein n=1 Tax=Burkholderia ubonensis TaxID=101571 RepID=UPI000757FFBA|nr:hypothetical protein [Burkholderia ubonensis]AOK62598.1 hypothetical protein WM29_26370 [Burkholderia ubonensis]KWN09119.1 hypothetical protein WM21_27145 [Burkholderia ubonensis]